MNRPLDPTYDSATDRTRPVHTAAYLDAVAADGPGRTFKQELLHALRLRPGHRVLDVGCGPGIDLPALHSRVRSSGFVLGVDSDPALCAEAARRTRDLPGTSVARCDAHALGLPADSFDHARCERVLMHVADPARAIAELRRVVRPSGTVILAEPDWSTLCVDHPDTTLSRTFTAAVRAHLALNPEIGRALPRLCHDAGLRVSTVTARTVLHRDYTTGDRVWGLARATAAAVTRGDLPAGRATDWLHHLRTGPFFGAITFVVVIAQA